MTPCIKINGDNQRDIFVGLLSRPGLRYVLVRSPRCDGSLAGPSVYGREYQHVQSLNAHGQSKITIVSRMR